MRLFSSIATFIKNLFSRDKKMTFKNDGGAFVISFKDREEEVQEEAPRRIETNNNQNTRRRTESNTARKAQSRPVSTQSSAQTRSNNNTRRTRVMTEDEKLELYIDRILKSQEEQSVNNKPKAKVKKLK